MLADGGQQLKTENKRSHPDGSSSTDDGEFTRIGTGSGFAGTWELQNSQVYSFIWVIKPYGNDGLSFARPAEKEHQEIAFDGKDYPDEGPQIAPGDTSSAKRIDGHTTQVTNKLNGKVTSTHESVVSQDGRTLTDTSYAAGQKKPVILVFDKQM